MTTLSRRHLLRGRWHHAATQVRPPWSVNESAFVIGCSRCHACISQCESGVLVVGQGHFPTLDFSRAECTFVGDAPMPAQRHCFSTRQRRLGTCRRRQTHTA